jgi:hypothetical protein
MDTHAGFVNITFGNSITNISASVTVPEAFVIECANIKGGKIIVNGADTTMFKIEAAGHPDDGQMYIEVESISGTSQGDDDDWSGYILNASGQNGHTAQILNVNIGSAHVKTSKRGLKIYSQFGPIFGRIGLATITHDTQNAIYFQTSATHGINLVMDFLDARDVNAATSLLHGDASAGTSGLVTITGGRLVKTGSTGAIFETDGPFKFVTGENLSMSPAAGGTVDVGANGSVLLPGQVKEASLASGSAVSLTTGTAANVTSLSLEPGKWLLSFQAAFTPTGSTSITRLIAAINTTSATIPAVGATNTARNQQFGAAYVPGGTPQVLTSGTVPFDLTSTTTVYAIVLGDFTASTLAGYGRFVATRLS